MLSNVLIMILILLKMCVWVIIIIARVDLIVNPYAIGSYP